MCTFRSEKAAARLSLHLTSGGAAFARVLAPGPTRMVILDGKSPMVEVARDGVVVRGHSETGILYPARPVVLAGFDVPGQYVTLDVSAAHGGGVTASLDGVPGMTLPSALRQSFACADLTLDEKSWDAAAVLPPGKTLRKLQLVRNRKIPLALEPKGAPLGFLDPLDDGDDGAVSVVAEKAGQARVVVARGTSTVFGWVSSGDLTRAPQTAAALQRAQMEALLSSLSTSGSGSANLSVLSSVTSRPAPSAADTPQGKPQALKCGRQLRLFATAAASSPVYLVGAIEPGTHLRVLERRPVLTLIEVPTGIEALDKATFLVPSRELGECTDVAPGARP